MSRVKYEYAIRKFYYDGHPEGVIEVLDGTLATTAGMVQVLQNSSLFPELRHVDLVRREVANWMPIVPSVSDWAEEKQRRRLRRI